MFHVVSPTEIDLFIFYNFLSSFSFIISLQRAMICNVRKSTKFGDFSSHTMALNTGHSLHEHLVTPLSSSHDHMQSEHGLAQNIQDLGVGMEWNKLSKIGRRFSWCFEHRIRGLVGFKICALQSQYRFQLLRVLENPNLLHESHVTILSQILKLLQKLSECITTTLNSSCYHMQTKVHLIDGRLFQLPTIIPTYIDFWIGCKIVHEQHAQSKINKRFWHVAEAFILEHKC